MTLSLPPELVELIVEHLLYDGHSLRSCALVARTWVIPCQRALFRDIVLNDSLEVTRLPAHLIRYPHLQRLVQVVTIWQAPDSSERSVGSCVLDNYMSCLTDLFPLFPCVISLDVNFDMYKSWDAQDQQFLEALGAFLRKSEYLTVLNIRNLHRDAEFQQILSFLEGSNVKQLTLEANPSGPGNPLPVDCFNPALSLTHLPAIELLHINTFYVFRLFSRSLDFWLRQSPTMFPNLKHCEVVVNGTSDLVIWLRDILQPTALRLQSFRLELMSYIFQDPDLPTDEGLFHCLHFQHFKLCTRQLGFEPFHPRTMTNWFSSMFCHLADSGTTVHFTELTFTFTNHHIEAVSAEWRVLDEVLSHAAFVGVRHIHFEEDSDERILITDQTHSELVSVIRSTLPHLDRRGVLCFL
ncbi:hypothetical protein BDZ89DRAFT_1079166 [Hymenopellis radicata]|nr:hypothetical protein BDZ89DRAFT_1079166 [Hymenopellis radicata]